jgi:hypothetical protein
LKTGKPEMADWLREQLVMHGLSESVKSVLRSWLARRTVVFHDSCAFWTNRSLASRPHGKESTQGETDEGTAAADAQPTIDHQFAGATTGFDKKRTFREIRCGTILQTIILERSVDLPICGA